ncbi:hypothetical protein N431DRAFT_459880 [Stipitochalara longipes BDJ]|nr:hypothetical protein N431DRAFT_459880 [Stipitochalara longipes BDJ]
MPLSKPTPAISLHPPTTPFTTLSPSHLTSTPPELLLAIISHLPPSALYPLSQTSRYLHTFLHTHAASICNTAIQTHYAHASSILRSTWTGAWLLPSHPAILNEERRILRDKILFSSCKCGPCRLVLSTSSSTSLSLSELEHVQGSGEGGLNCLGALRKDSCKAHPQIEACLKLSAPGPQYLVFLEKYSWEIVTRYSMSSFSSVSPAPSNAVSASQDDNTATSPTSSTSTANGEGDAEGDEAEEERQRQEQEKEEAMFEFMVGNYCVRRFLDSAEKCIASLPSSQPEIPAPSSPQVQFNKLRRKLRKRMRASKEKAAIIVEVAEVVDDGEGRNERTAPPPPQGTPRRMMFGEISPSSPTDEKALLVSQKKAKVERWEDGLLWYYGLQGLGEQGVEKEEEEEIEEIDEKEERKERGCVAAVKRGLGIIRRRVRGMFLGRCVGMGRVRVGGFRALEG